MSYSNAIIPIRLTRETDHPKEYLCITGNLFYIGLQKIRQDVTYRGMNLENYREYCLSMGEDAGSIVLPPKVLNARYVMLHNGTNGTLFKLKGAGLVSCRKKPCKRKASNHLVTTTTSSILSIPHNQKTTTISPPLPVANRPPPHGLPLGRN